MAVPGYNKTKWRVTVC